MSSKQIKESIIFIFILVIIMLSYSLLVYKNSYTPSWLSEIVSIVNKKKKIAESKTSPKLIIVGGSNSLRGISARLIEQELGINTVNYSFFAEMNEYNFELAKNVLSPGDTVLLSLYYHYYYYDKKIMFGKQTSKERYIMSNDRDYFESLGIIEKLNYMLIGLDDLHQNIVSNNKKITKKGYVINDWGDMIEPNERKIEDEYKINEKEYFKQPDNVHVNFEKYSAVKDLRSFIDWLKENEIKILVTYPSVPASFDEINRKNKDYLNMIYDFYNDERLLSLGSPSDYFEDARYFLDDQHLNNEGRIKKTEFVLSKIEELELLIK